MAEHIVQRLRTAERRRKKARRALTSEEIAEAPTDEFILPKLEVAL